MDAVSLCYALIPVLSVPETPSGAEQVEARLQLGLMVPFEESVGASGSLRDRHSRPTCVPFLCVFRASLCSQALGIYCVGEASERYCGLQSSNPQ